MVPLIILFGIVLHAIYTIIICVCEVTSIHDKHECARKNLNAFSVKAYISPAVEDDLKFSSRVIPTTLSSAELIEKWNKLSR